MHSIEHFPVSDEGDRRLVDDERIKQDCEIYVRDELGRAIEGLELGLFHFDKLAHGWVITSESNRIEPRERIILHEEQEVDFPFFRDIMEWVRHAVQHLASQYGDGDPLSGFLSVTRARMRNDDPAAFLRAGLLGEGEAFPGLVLVDGLTDEEMIECCDDSGHQGSSMEFITFTVEPDRRWEEQRTALLGFARAVRRHGRPFFLVNTISPTELRIGIAPAVGAQYAVPRPLRSTQEESGPAKEAA